MLESGGALKAYRLELPPALLLDQPCAAKPIDDHPLRFLTYEGSVNKGLGKVHIVDSGWYQLLEVGREFLRLVLNGKILKGQFRLARIAGSGWEFERRFNGSDVR